MEININVYIPRSVFTLSFKKFHYMRGMQNSCANVVFYYLNMKYSNTLFFNIVGIMGLLPILKNNYIKLYYEVRGTLAVYIWIHI